MAAGPAGNPNAVGLDVSAQRIRSVAEQCLRQVGPDAPGLVRAMVVGLAGGSRADETFLDRRGTQRNSGADRDWSPT